MGTLGDGTGIGSGFELRGGVDGAGIGGGNGGGGMGMGRGGEGVESRVTVDVGDDVRYPGEDRDRDR